MLPLPDWATPARLCLLLVRGAGFEPALDTSGREHDNEPQIVLTPKYTVSKSDFAIGRPAYMQILLDV